MITFSHIKKSVIIPLSFILLISLLLFSCSDGGEEMGYIADDETDTQTTEAPDVEIPDDIGILLQSSESGKGNLVLVNYAYPYEFTSGENDIVSFNSAKNDYYKLAQGNLRLNKNVIEKINEMTAAFYAYSGLSDLIINSAYRSYADQEEIYAYYFDNYGSEYTSQYVADPGYSEHHTALAYDMSVYTDEGEAYHINTSEIHSWVYQNMWQYGFVLRYDASKVDITKISGEDWHIRYVGRPHAYYMTYYGLCLEEYIDLIATYYNREAPLYFNDTELGCSYKIFYSPASPADETLITLPNDGYSSYEISGTNTGGFIVTLTYN